MKKLIILTLIILTLIGLTTAQSQNSRYFIESNSPNLKAEFGLQHNFKDGFTANLNNAQVKKLQKQGIEVNEIQLYQPTGKPVCGDGKCQGKETSTCPEDCSTDPPEEPTRNCLPEQQIPYGINMIKGGNGGDNINIAILDTGVSSHLDLDIKDCKDTTKRGIRNGCSDQDGHGTHVTGTVGANGGQDGQGIFGVAPNSNLWMIKVCGKSGCWSDDMAEAIYYATDKGAHIITMSIGGNSESQLTKDAITYAVQNGVLVLAAAGNDGPDFGTIDYPAANKDVIAVAAIDEFQNVASWSSRGINDGDFVIEEREVELALPGVAVESTFKDGCYTKYSGTSMATPHAAGLAALYWQGDSQSTRTKLQSVAQDIAAVGDDPATGFGLPIFS